MPADDPPTQLRDHVTRHLGLWAWLLYLVGLLCLAGIDAALRARGPTAPGLGEPLLPLLALTLAAACAALLWRASLARPTAARVVLLLLQLGLGFVLYVIAALAYFCGTGIDCP
jgi:hypothetical protein